jgi:hypothetical protein
MLPFAVELKLPEDNIILSYNGGMAKTVGGKLLFERPVPAQYGEEIVDYCKKHKLHLNFYFDDKLYVSELNEWTELYEKRSGSASIPIGDLSKMNMHSPTKMIIVDEKEKLDKLIPEFKEKYRDKLYITKTDDEYLEFMAAGVDKGTGLLWVCDKLGIPQDTTAAFGDSFNDVQMIEWAGVGIAMSNGKEAAKAAADIVVDNSSWTGVGDTMRSFL